MLKVKLMLGTAMMVLAFSQQSNAQQGLRIGINVMPQNTWMLNDDDSADGNHEYLPTFGMAYGVSLGYNFGDNFGLELNPMFSSQGQKSKSYGFEFSQRNDYFKVPVLLSFNTNPYGKVQFLGKVGPQVEFLASSKLKDVDNDVLVDDTKESYSSVNVGAVLSLGTAFSVTDFLQLTAGFRFDGSFNNIENQDEPFYPVNRASTFNLTGGLDIGLKLLF